MPDRLAPPPEIAAAVSAEVLDDLRSRDGYVGWWEAVKACS